MREKGSVAIVLVIVGLILLITIMLYLVASSEMASAAGSAGSANPSGFWWPIGPTTPDDYTSAPQLTALTRGYTSGNHLGIDIDGLSQYNVWDVIASAPGKVIVMNDGLGTGYYGSPDGYGNYVVIEHTLSDGGSFYTIYGHMYQNTISVHEGDTVQAGQFLGKVGSSGNSTGAHLHYEMRTTWPDRNTVDPMEKDAGHPYVDPDNPYPQGGTEGDTNTSERLLMLVNQWNTIPDDSWVPTGLVFANSGEYLLSEAKEGYDNLCAAYGSRITICSGYRSYATQNSMDWRNNPLIAAPNATEHRTGLAVDFVSATQWGKWIESNRGLWNWLCNNAMNYGFILRYPLGCQDTTGILAESWHWRYIGVDRAKDFYAAARGLGRATTPRAQKAKQSSDDVITNDTTTYYLYTYEEYYRDYVSQNKYYQDR